MNDINHEMRSSLPKIRLKALGREVGSRTWVETESLHTDRVYDANGRLWKLSRPHTQRGNNQYGWTEYVRDDLGRVTTMKSNNQLGSGVETTTFGELLSTTDPLGNQIKVEYDRPGLDADQPGLGLRHAVDLRQLQTSQNRKPSPPRYRRHQRSLCELIGNSLTKDLRRT